MSDILETIRLKNVHAFVQGCEEERRKVPGIVVIYELGSKLGRNVSEYIYALDFVWDERGKERACVLSNYSQSNCSKSNMDFDKFANSLERGRLILMQSKKDRIYRAVAA